MTETANKENNPDAAENYKAGSLSDHNDLNDLNDGLDEDFDRFRTEEHEKANSPYMTEDHQKIFEKFAGELENQDSSQEAGEDNLEVSEDFETGDTAKPAKKPQRPLWINIIAIIVCIYGLFSIRGDLMFYFMRSEPVPLGESIGFEQTDLPSNSYVTVSGMRNPSKGIQLNALFSDKNVFQLIGTKMIYVETLVEDDKKMEGLSVETFSGRLARFSEISYFNTVRDFAAFRFGVDISEDALLIKVYEKPGETHWVPLLAVFLLAIFLRNIYTLIRRLMNR